MAKQTMSAVDENTYILIGSELSYFAAKIRAYLQWKGIPFVQALASQRVYAEIIRPLTHANFIPILILPRSHTGGIPRAIQDTRGMVRYLEQHHQDLKHNVIPASSPALAFSAAWLEVLADQWLAIQGRFWMGEKEILDQQREWIMTELGDTILGGKKATMEAKMKAEQQAWTDFPRVLPNLGITDATGPAIRQQFLYVLSLLSEHLAHHRFLLGDRISLADFSLYAPFYAHLSRNPVPGFLLKTRAPLVFEWIERVGGAGRAGSAHGGVVALDEHGEWVDEYASVPEDRELPATLVPLLELWLGDYLPLVAESCEQVTRFLEDGKGKSVKQRNGWVELPRAIGWQRFELRSGKDGLVAKGKRVISPHAVWMLQELVKEVYDGQETEGDGVMSRVGGNAMVETWRKCVEWARNGKWTLERVDNRLVAGPRNEEAGGPKL